MLCGICRLIQSPLATLVFYIRNSVATGHAYPGIYDPRATARVFQKQSYGSLHSTDQFGGTRMVGLGEWREKARV